MIAGAVPKMTEQLAVFERALAAEPYLAGAEPSLADWMLFPIIAYVRITPEGEAAMPKAPKLGAWFARIAARPSAPATDPARG
jgi:glutathione S-transferase